jgi:hypothetical protein
MMQGYTAAQKEDLLVGLATLAIYDGGVELSVRHTASHLQVPSPLPMAVLDAFNLKFRSMCLH